MAATGEATAPLGEDEGGRATQELLNAAADWGGGVYSTLTTHSEAPL